MLAQRCIGYTGKSKPKLAKLSDVTKGTKRKEDGKDESKRPVKKHKSDGSSIPKKDTAGVRKMDESDDGEAEYQPKPLRGRHKKADVMSNDSEATDEETTECESKGAHCT